MESSRRQQAQADLGKKSMFLYIYSALFQSKSPFPSSSSSMPNPITLRLSALKGLDDKLIGLVLHPHWGILICNQTHHTP